MPQRCSQAMAVRCPKRRHRVLASKPTQQPVSRYHQTGSNRSVRHTQQQTSTSPTTSDKPSALCHLPAETRLLIYSYLLPTHINASYCSTAQHLLLSPSPNPLVSLLQTCRLIHNELAPISTRDISSVLWQLPHRLFDASTAKWRTWREVTSCPRLIPDKVACQIREIELVVGCRGWACRKCVEDQLVVWKERSPVLERVLFVLDVERAEYPGLGQAVTRLDDVDEEEAAKTALALHGTVYERWGWLDGVTVPEGVSVLVESSVLGKVSMRCKQKREACGRECFDANFAYHVVDIGQRKVIEFGRQLCAESKRAGDYHRAHVRRMNGSVGCTRC